MKSRGPFSSLGGRFYRCRHRPLVYLHGTTRCAAALSEGTACYGSTDKPMTIGDVSPRDFLSWRRCIVPFSAALNMKRAAPLPVRAVITV